MTIAQTSCATPERKAFTFYLSYEEVISMLPDGDQLAVYKAIIQYALHGIMPDMESESLCARLAVKAFMPHLEADRTRFKNGCKGGASKRKSSAQPAPKEEASAQTNPSNGGANPSSGGGVAENAQNQGAPNPSNGGGVAENAQNQGAPNPSSGEANPSSGGGVAENAQNQGAPNPSNGEGVAVQNSVPIQNSVAVQGNMQVQNYMPVQNPVPMYNPVPVVITPMSEDELKKLPFEERVLQVYNEWLYKNAPTVLQFAEPMTANQLDDLRHRYSDPIIKECSAQLHNKSIYLQNRSVYITMRRWLNTMK